MSAASEVVVEIPQGKLQGKKETSVFGEEFFSFHRIPYAKPPVGELRFRAPQPAGGWTGIRDATQEGKVCPSSEWTEPTYIKDGDEDSLFVNVFCKQSPKSAGMKKFPVLFWIHGGGFEFGSGNKLLCGPDYLMSYDVLLVTFNYRIGPLGFLSLQTVECPGNFGLKDQQLALRWVKNNIAYFGGDPDNITMFGVSAGGVSVHYQMLALSNRGLFRRAIAQSGSAINHWAYANSPRENAFLLGKRLGCDTKDDKVLLDFLRKASAEEITVKSQKIILETEGTSPGSHFLRFTFVPTTEPEHEGAFITKHPWVLMEEGHYLDVPLIVGICAREMIPAVKGSDDYPSFTRVEEFQQLIPNDIRLDRNTERALEMAKHLKEVYFKDGVTLDGYVDVLSDNSFNYGIYKIVKNRTENGAIKSPTFLYVFSYEGSQKLVKTFMGDNGLKGATHGDDTCYLFKTNSVVMETVKPGTKDHKMIKNFTELWVNFATTGIPKLEEAGVNWKPAGKDMEYLLLGDSFVMKKHFLKERMELWDNFYTAYHSH